MRHTEPYSRLPCPPASHHSKRCVHRSPAISSYDAPPRLPPHMPPPVATPFVLTRAPIPCVFPSIYLPGSCKGRVEGLRRWGGMGGLVGSLMNLLAQDQPEGIYMGATRVRRKQCLGVLTSSCVMGAAGNLTLVCVCVFVLFVFVLFVFVFVCLWLAWRA